MPLRIWKTSHHEVMETVLRSRYEAQDEVTLEGAAGGPLRWRVLSVEKHPHGWRITAARCLPGCPDHAPAATV